MSRFTYVSVVMHSRLARIAAKLVGSFLILVVLALAIGFAYTYWMGRTPAKPAASPAPPPPAASHELPKPAQIAKNAKVGIAVVALSSPVAPGAAASLQGKTLPGAVCQAAISPSGAGMLSPATADTYGALSWEWLVPASARPGPYGLSINCQRDSQSAVLTTSFEVSRQ